MSKAKMIKDVISFVKKIKERAEYLTKQMNALKADLEEIKNIVMRIKAELEKDADKLIALGKKCFDSKKSGIKDCYELAYEKIEEKKKQVEKASEGSCCCSTF